ncbi:cell division protein DedD [Shewanella intestini]|uniref:Cell division protein DedD n=1 Tax=Shewanella intestini TaxID=2017544 RepID=A0ABS5HYS1_9GAMM|nr:MULTISPECIES: cell division protein DedD [Shewanella]MBR9726919.1 cell division protein DedD [Shewanella intestini]MRG34515.1 cell division protein DedD [Shewanella sp. XMDDZSB0408]
MDRQFQNRLVGTIVLVALGVIILPDLLDGKKNHVVEEFTDIPLRPMSVASEGNEQPESFEVIDIAKGQDLGTEPTEPTESAANVQSKSRLTETQAHNTTVVAAKPRDTKSTQAKPAKQQTVHTATSSSPKVQQKVSSVKTGYTLQLGGFKNAQNVSALIAQLRLSGYTAYTVPATPVDGNITRVFVGPDTNQNKLKQARDPIRKLTGLSGKVIPFNPAG